MLQETHTEPRALRRPFDETGDVRHHEAALRIDTHYTKARDQRGERIIGDLGPRRGDRADQGRLAGFGQTQLTLVVQLFELELEFAHLARRAFRDLARRAIGAALESRVADTKTTTKHNQQGLTR